MSEEKSQLDGGEVLTADDADSPEMEFFRFIKHIVKTQCDPWVYGMFLKGMFFVAVDNDHPCIYSDHGNTISSMQWEHICDQIFKGLERTPNKWFRR